MTVLNSASDHKFSLGVVLFKSAIWITISCLALLFLPPKILTALLLQDFVAAKYDLIGSICLIACVYIICYLLNTIVDELAVLLLKKRQSNKIKNRIKLLDLAERALLREFFLQGVSVLTLPLYLDIVTDLAKANILERIENNNNEHRNNDHSKSEQRKTAHFKISVLARKHLNRRVLGLPCGNLTEYDILRLKKTRPKYIHYLKKHRDYAA